MNPFWAGALVFSVSVAWVAAEDAPKPIFEDRLTSTLAKEWTWPVEHPGEWRMGKNGLEMHVLPAKNKNMLFAPLMKAGSEVAVEVFVEIHPSAQFEHAGLNCYFDEDNVIGLACEHEVVLRHHKNGKSDYQTAPHREGTLWLRLEISKGQATGFYKEKPEEPWKRLGECDLPKDGDFHIGLSTSAWPNGTDDWARFRDFRIIPLGK